jgi:hypothetical protein
MEGAKSRARIACCVTALGPLGLSLEARRCLDAADAARSRVQEGPRWSRAFGRRELKSTAGLAHADGSIERAGPRYASARVWFLRRLVLGGMESPNTVEPRLVPLNPTHACSQGHRLLCCSLLLPRSLDVSYRLRTHTGRAQRSARTASSDPATSGVEQTQHCNLATPSAAGDKSRYSTPALERVFLGSIPLADYWAARGKC